MAIGTALPVAGLPTLTTRHPVHTSSVPEAVVFEDSGTRTQTSGSRSSAP